MLFNIIIRTRQNNANVAFDTATYKRTNGYKTWNVVKTYQDVTYEDLVWIAPTLAKFELGKWHQWHLHIYLSVRTLLCWSQNLHIVLSNPYQIAFILLTSCVFWFIYNVEMCILIPLMYSPIQKWLFWVTYSVTVSVGYIWL